MLKSLVPLLTLSLFLASCGEENRSNTTAAPTSTKTEQSNEVIELTSVDDVSGVSADNVFTFVCELVEQKPELVSTTCADLGEGVFDISWNTWSASGASGIGTYSVNDCEPNCADGTRIEARVAVSLENLVTDGERYYLTNFSYQGDSDFPDDYPNQDKWDLSEFYLMINN